MGVFVLLDIPSLSLRRLDLSQPILCSQLAVANAFPPASAIVVDVNPVALTGGLRDVLSTFAVLNFYRIPPFARAWSSCRGWMLQANRSLP